MGGSTQGMLHVRFLAVEEHAVAGLQTVVTIHLVITAQAALADIGGFGYVGEGFALPYHHVDHIVAEADTIQDVFVRHSISTMCTLQAVVLHQIVLLNDVDKQLCIRRVGGIACRLQPSCPTYIVRRFQVIEGSIARTSEKKRMVLIALLHTSVFPEAVVRTVVALDDVRTGPVTSHLDAEMVVGLDGKHGPSGIALKKPLCQGDARRHTIALHLVDSHGMIPGHVLLVDTVLCRGECCKGKKYERG